MDLGLYNRAEYFEQLTQDVNATNAGDRVAIATMIYDPEEPLIQNLTVALGAAAARDVDVCLAVDAYSFLTNEKTKIPGPAWLNPTVNQRMRQPFQGRLDALEEMATKGVRYAITNMPKHPFSIVSSGRSHIKTAVVNNVIYSGGCNLDSQSDIDVMVSIEHHAAADWMYGIVSKMIKTGDTHEVFHDNDQTFELSPSTHLLLDSGKRGQSIILHDAFEFIDSAKEFIFYTCQYPPGGETAQHLLAAQRRNVAVSILFSHLSKQGKQEPLYRLYALGQKLKLPPNFFNGELSKGQPYMHAKLIATEQGVRVGSHNFITAGVSLGTAELTLRSTEPGFSARIIQKIKEQL